MPHSRTVTYFFYDGSKLTAEADERGEITRHFIYLQDRLVTMLSGDRSYAIHTDWRGAPVAATDERQRVMWRADVEVFGAINRERGEFSLPLRASNQYFDRETGFHYNLHRYFDPSTARYLTPDPLGQAGGLNLYAFVGGDPVNAIDPLGLQAIPADWGTMDRVGALLRATGSALPGAAYAEMVEALRELISPAGLAVTATMFTAWAASQFTPLGWAADVAILGVGFVFMGIAIVELAMGTAAAYRAMRAAQTLEDLCAAGRDFANVLAEAAIQLGGGAGIAGAARAGGRQLAAQMRRMFGQNSRAPPPGPLPFTLEMPTRVVDGFGNQIRQFMAGRANTWSTGPERLRWQWLEDAAKSFARREFNAEYVFDAKHRGGQIHPLGTNGFDVVFVKPDGTLVIGEAKSGARINEITAFRGR
jgi:RHS repeat-associated protein